ncbi:DUF418 domain-containing protein [Actinomadura madurae]|nr:DUF418 domain-containing protein [Actinomadura madurae]MCP9955837.1 DUF418 domain-containing protein [Actinomadura madurae]MCP9972570.1 DUF418 domain-containing protein [Actinomadura madurae]MCP9985078.1 DUF418 domain-containing protein [Actinomadura madurae]MCQ0003356.1 DUF418 domain-containing protein [Actinomadura madurae]MCQ0021295.1 DUF418 domain-containing protein [Actinomadura madurae]
MVNTVSITNMPNGESRPGVGYWAFETLLHQRFFPIFAFLFGVSFGLFLDAARDKARHPRLVMLARLGFLVPFGAAHRLVQPDEVLLTYAVVGITVLIPASLLPGRPVAALGILGVAAGLVAGGGSLLTPGLFLFGLGVQRRGLRNATAMRVPHLTIACCATLAVAACLNTWQVAGGTDTGPQRAALAGVVTAGGYVLGILVLFRTRARRVLRHLAPVGRMALTGYIGGTLLILAAGRLIDFGETPRYGWAISLGVCVFAIEVAFSWVWLRRARYGPLEWIWRCLTWWRIEPNTRSSRI